MPNINWLTFENFFLQTFDVNLKCRRCVPILKFKNKHHNLSKKKKVKKYTSLWPQPNLL